MINLRMDLVHAVRALRRRPFFAGFVACVLSLALGANAIVISAIDGVLLHPVETADARNVVVIHDDFPGLGLRDAAMSPAETQDLSERNDIFEANGGFTMADFNVAVGTSSERMPVAATIGEFFDVFRARASLGHLYTAANSTPGADQVVVLSDALWRTEFGRRRAVIGTQVMINASSYVVIGVMQPGFDYPSRVAAWIPFTLNAAMREPTRRLSLFMTAVARLRPPASRSRLDAALAFETAKWHSAWPSVYEPRYRHRLVAQPLGESVAGPLRPLLFGAFLAVMLLCAIATANVAGMVLVRAMSRERELALIAALGGGRFAIARRLTIEAGILGALGGAVALAMSGVLLPILDQRVQASYPQVASVTLDWRAVLVTVGIVALVTLGISAMPVMRLREVDVLPSLVGGGRTVTSGIKSQRILGATVMAQLAVALVLSVGACAVVVRVRDIIRLHPGFRTQSIVTAKVSLSQVRGSAFAQGAAASRTFTQLRDALRAGRQSDEVGLVSDLPFGGSTNSVAYQVSGGIATDSVLHADLRQVDDNYFRVMGIPLEAGRVFASTDVDTAALVAVIDSRLARAVFGTGSPLGKALILGRPATIVGVVGSILEDASSDHGQPTIYLCYRQVPVWTMTFVVGTMRSPDEIASGLRRAIARLAPGTPTYDIRSMESVVASSTATQRVGATLIVALAIFAAVLAALGMYGLLAYRTDQRLRELAIRAALGATSTDLAGLVFRQATPLAAGGIAIGVAAVLVLRPVVASMMVGPPSITTPLVACSLILLVVAVAGAIAPARRASAAAPADILRAD